MQHEPVTTNMNNPGNSDLDALFLRSTTHPEVRMDLCREMLEGELYTLIPEVRVPGEEGEVVELEATAENIPLMVWSRDGKDYFFVYTSERQAEKALKAFTGPAFKKMMIICMDGRDMLTLMSRPGVGIALNAGAGKHDYTFNDAVLTGMLDGTMFAPPPSEEVQGQVKALRPEQYPLSLVQPVFDYLKTRPEVLAAWVLEMKAARERGQNYYVFALLTSTEDAQELQDAVGTVLAMVNRSDREGMEFGVTSFDYGDPAQVTIMRTFVPFYAAPGYSSPALPGQE